MSHQINAACLSRQARCKLVYWYPGIRTGNCTAPVTSFNSPFGSLPFFSVLFSLLTQRAPQLYMLVPIPMSLESARRLILASWLEAKCCLTLS